MEHSHNSHNSFFQAVRTEKQDLTTPVLESHRRLLESGRSEHEISEALSRVGQASDVDRVYIFDVEPAADGSHLASQRFEWVAGGVTPQIDNPDLQNVVLETAGYSRWVRLLSNYEPVFGLIEEFPEEEKPLLTEQSIISLLVVPIFLEGELRGFVGFDHCRARKVWTESDVDLLISLSIAIAPGISSGEQGPDTFNTQAVNYVNLIRSLLSLRDVAGSKQPISDILGKIRARIRALVSIHRFLTRRGSPINIDTSEFLGFWEQELRATLDSCNQTHMRLQVMSQPFPLPENLVLQTALITHELLLAYACRESESLRDGGLSLGIHEENGTVAIRLHYIDGRRNVAPPTPDPLGLVLVRSLVQSLSGYLEIPGADAAARVSLPMQATPVAEG